MVLGRDDPADHDDNVVAAPLAELGDQLGQRSVQILNGAARAVPIIGAIALGPLGVADAQSSSSTPAKPAALSSTQKRCLEDRAQAFLEQHSGQAISLSLIAAVRQAVPDAAKACGVTLPSNAEGKATQERSKLGVTLEQVQCVLSKGVPLPTVGAGQLPTTDVLQTLRQELITAAQACGVTVPAQLGGGTSI